MIFGQRETAWKDIPLGFGLGTIGEVGCTLTSVAMCLYDAGYTDVTPANVNQKLKDANAFVSQNLLDWSKLKLAYPQIEYKESLNYPTVAAQLNVLQDYLNQGFSVIIKINGAAIGGRGDHFVKASRVEGNNVIVKDPWYKKEATITSLFTLDWADTAPEIITGYRVLKVFAPQVTTPTDQITIPKDTFNQLSQYSEKWKDICGRFGTDVNNTDGLNLFSRYDEVKTNLSTANKDYATLKAAKEEVDGLLKISQTTSEARKKTHDDLLEWEATTLGCSPDEAIIKGEIKSLVDVEGKLETANKTITDLKETHENERITWQKQIEDLRAEVTTWKEKAEGFQIKLNQLEEKITEQQTTVEKVNFIKKMVDDIVSWFTKRKIEQDAQQMKDKTK